MNLIGKLVCLVTRKHKRGKRVPGTPILECPRCRTRWERPITKAKA